MKAKIKDTGEVVDVHWEGNLDAYLGKLASGRCREFKERELEFLETNNIDWEQRRFELIKSAIQGFCANSEPSIAQETTLQQLAGWSIEMADIIIAELKKEGRYNTEEPRPTLLKEPELLAECTAEALLTHAKKMHTMNRGI